jgi:hypothetical protein
MFDEQIRKRTHTLFETVGASLHRKGISADATTAFGLIVGLGGVLDLTADVCVYSGVVVGLAVAIPSARLSCAVLLAVYYINITTLLACSHLLDDLRVPSRDERSIRLGGMVEGTETIVVYCAMLIFHRWASAMCWMFAASVAVTAIARLIDVRRTIRRYGAEVLRA